MTRTHHRNHLVGLWPLLTLLLAFSSAGCLASGGDGGGHHDGGYQDGGSGAGADDGPTGGPISCGSGSATCPAGSYCDLGSNVCKPGCGNDSQCTRAGQAACDLVSHTCECAAGYHRCGDQCASDTSVDTCGASCNACPVPANATSATCNGTTCGVACGSGYHACGDACAMDTSLGSCGSACTPCPVPAHATAATCDGTSCGFTCEPGYHACGSRCVPDTSVASCGASCNACPVPANASAASCDGQSCGVVCAAGFHECGGACASDTSPSSCGGACSPCTAPPNATATCDGASCGFRCDAGYHLCGGVCVSDSAVATCGGSCSACASPGNGTATCDGTSCGISCSAGYHVCGNACASSTSLATCGTSCTACPAPPTHATATCDGTACGFACSTGYLACGAACCTPLTGVAQVSGGSGHTCAVTTGGGVLCWGNGYEGQLGDGSFVPSTAPVAVSGLGAGVAQVSAGGEHTCVLTTAGAVECWGLNGSGQVGDGTFASRNVPVPVSGLGPGVLAVATGPRESCAITAAGEVECWGSVYGPAQPSPAVVTGIGGTVTAIALGEGHACVLTTGGGVVCWGSNYYGQIGNGTVSTSSPPVGVSGLGSGVVAIAAGADSTCAITTGGEVKCWGANLVGELGDGTTTSRSTPVVAKNLTSGVTQIAVGGAFAGAVTSAGEVYTWGANNVGQIGFGGFGGRMTVPVPATTVPSGPSGMTAGEDHFCVVLPSAGVQCWGGNYAGQLGDGTKTDRASAGPVLVP